MTSESNTSKNYSPVTSMDSSLQGNKKRVRYVLPKGCVIDGTYRIEKPLGHGGMGEVYLAYHMQLDIYRAIKILLPKIAVKNPVFAKRFMQEARLAIRLQHPNIINVMDAKEDKRLSVYYIVMEYIDGGTVRNLIRKNGPMDELEVLKIVLRVGEALAAGEAKRIVHRDIKPDNIMLTRDNVVKLADLGIAKDALEGGDSDMTSAEVLIGTPAYVSPEQARDAQNVDSRADIYSLGVSMYEMLTGEKPYKGQSTLEILQQLFEAPIPEVRQKNRNVSKRVSDLVFRMMAKEKEHRPRNWNVFCREVAKLIEEETPESAADTQITSIEELDELFPGRNRKVVLDNDEGRSFIDKKKIKKIAGKLSFVLIGCALCFVLFSVFLTPEKVTQLESSVTLQLIGEKYREQCEKRKIKKLPLYLVFSPDEVKQSWIDSHIKAQSSPPPEPPNPPEPPKPPENGTLKIVISATPELENYLMEKGYKLKVDADNQISDVKIAPPGGEIPKLPSGEYTLKMSMPECQPVSPVTVMLGRNAFHPVEVTLVPIDATVKFKSSVSKFQVWWNNSWQEAETLKVSSLRNVELGFRAEGYKRVFIPVKLNPGETRTLDLRFEPLPPDRSIGKNMQLANEAFNGKKYATALKLYQAEAENGNALAMFRLGVIYEERLVQSMWFADKVKAFRYYRMAAERDMAEAMFKVGEFYENGMGGVRTSNENALKWYIRGAAVNHLPCQLKRAAFYEEGKGGLERDQEMALKLYLQSALKGDACSQFRAARIYENKMRLETTQNKRDEYRKLAKRFYEAAARQNYGEAISRLREL